LIAVLVGPAGAQTVEEIAGRDRLIAGQEALLNEYRCRFDVDTVIVLDGCIGGGWMGEFVAPGPFAGMPTPEELYRRDLLIADQEALLNAYRCQFGVDVLIVPGGCSVWSAFTVPVFFCGPLGRFSGEDVETAVTSLNREVSPWFARESSGHTHIRFVEGRVVIPDFD